MIGTNGGLRFPRTGSRLAFLRSIPPHPLLLAAWPVIFLYGQNAGEADPADAFVVLTVTLAVMAAAWLGLAVAGRIILWIAGDRIGTDRRGLIARLLLVDPERAAVAVSSVVILFFSYGRVLEAVRGPVLSGGRLFVIWLLLMAVGAFLAMVAPSGLVHRTSRAASVLGLALVTVSLGAIVSSGSGVGPGASTPSATPLPDASAGRGLDRDIYYILVEDVGAEWTLRRFYGLQDPSTFQWLRGLGFVVTERSTTNYGKTLQMLAATLNLEYLDDLAAHVGRSSGDYRPLHRLVDDHLVGRFLKARGYRYYHIGGWWDPTKQSSIADVNYGLASPSDFASTLAQTTMLPALDGRLARFGIRLPFGRLLTGDDRQIASFRTAYRALDRLVDTPGPKFVFAHILTPHPPYVFRADGSLFTSEERRRMGHDGAFLETVLYTNEKIREVVTRLLARPPEERPIVIVQTDEGPSPIEAVEDREHYRWTEMSQDELDIKFAILNAFYLPGVSDTGLYPTISAVNTFRVVFRLYFGADLPDLPDRNFIFPDKSHPYDFIDVTDRLTRPGPASP